MFQLPSYAPGLKPTEGIWSLVKRDIGNLAAAHLYQITCAVKRKLKMLQYRPEAIDCRLSGIGLACCGDHLNRDEAGCTPDQHQRE